MTTPILKVKDSLGNWTEIPALQGESAYQLALKQGFKGTQEEWITSLQGEDGVSGVYVGSGDMPEGYNVQVDPNGEILTSPVTSVNRQTGDVILDIPDVSNFATTTYVNNKIDAIQIPSVENLATEDFVIEKINEAQLDGGDIDIDLSIYPTNDEVDTKIENYLGKGAIQISFAEGDTTKLNYIGTVGNGTDKLPNGSIIVVHPTIGPASTGNITLTINGYGPYPIYQRTSLGIGPMRLRPIPSGHFVSSYRSLILRLCYNSIWIAEDISLPRSADYNAPNGFITKELLWTNASPLEEFSQQTLSFNVNRNINSIMGIIVTAEIDISGDVFTEEDYCSTVWISSETYTNNCKMITLKNWTGSWEGLTRTTRFSCTKVDDNNTTINCYFGRCEVYDLNDSAALTNNRYLVPINIYVIYSITEAEGGEIFV